MEREARLEVLKECVGERLDKFINKNINNVSRSYAQGLIKQKKVLVNGTSNKDKNYKLIEGDIVIVKLDAPQEISTQAEEIALEIMYEDKDLLVVNKPKGMVVHPAAGNYSGTLVNALLHYCEGNLSGINGKIRPGIVHRIDKDTSGLLVVAKNDESHRGLAQQIKSHTFSRRYESIVYGNLNQDKGTINAPIGRHRVDRKRMTVTQQNSKEAITHYKVIKRYAGYTHIEVTLETGRTHQIRVHMEHIGHGIVGDVVYGQKKEIAGLNGQCLHAGLIGFNHPISGKYIEVQSELPEYFKNFLKGLTPKNQEA